MFLNNFFIPGRVEMPASSIFFNYRLFLRPVVFILLGLSASISYAQSRGIVIESIKNVSVTPFVPGQFRALIIGNDKYSDPSKRWFPLKTAVADATAVAKTLSENYGFADVTRLTNASRRDILFALAELSKRVLPNDSVLVYYAGHGYIDPDTDKGYWVPSDAIGSDHTTFLRNSTIRDELGVIATRSKHTLLIADSCFSGTLLRRGASVPNPENKNTNYYKKVANKKSVQIMTSGGVEYVDDNYRESGHSPFTYFLLNELKHNDNEMLTVSEISANVTKAVANNVEQTPNSGVLSGSGDELGEFIFIKVKLKLDVTGIEKEKIKVSVEVVQDPDGQSLENIDVEKIVTINKPAANINTVIKRKKAAKKASKKPSPQSMENLMFPIPSL